MIENTKDVDTVKAASDDRPPPAVSLREASGFWFKLGLISFGGPAGQIAIMHRELVERRRWLSERRFLHALNYCMLLPGPEAQQLATYIGWLLHRVPGGLVAGALFVLPSLALLILLSWVYLSFHDVPLVAGIFYGIKPAVTAVVLHAAHRIGSRTLHDGALWSIAAAAFVAVFAFGVPFPAILATAAVTGYLGGRLVPQRFGCGRGQAETERACGVALIDDDTPAPAHARFSFPRLSKTLVLGFALWSLSMIALAGAFGWHHTLMRMGWFFTKAALLTFGGAYAVLPYVYQGAVVDHGWLNATQMIDGLALGETTPGPLIMVVAFVGFVGGYGHALFGGDHLFLAGAAAAIVVTWFTFLPSFLFIFAGGPLIESTHDRPTFTAPLAAIAAAVVGVIVNLALFFACHVLWPEGWGGGFDVAAAGIAVAAAVALFRFKRDVIHVIVGCAAAGLVTRLLGG